MAALAGFSLPILLSPPPLKSHRFLSSPPRPANFAASKRLRIPHAVARVGNGQPSLWRLVTSEGNPGEVVPTSVPVRVAHELLQAGHRYLDVRTVDEFDAGHAVGAINIPYMFKVGSGTTKNPNFLKEVLSIFGKDDEIIIGCQSGRRSLMAAAELSYAGFTGITDIAGGYSAWTQNGLPIEQ